MQKLKPLEHIFWSAPHNDFGHTLLVLHDLGQDERSLLRMMIPYGESYHVLSLKGNVGMGSQWGYYLPEFEPHQLREELRSRSKDFHSMLLQLADHYNIDKRKIIGVGYKHGASFLSALILCYPELFEGAILIRPHLTINPNEEHAVVDLPILIADSKAQAFYSIMDTMQTIQMLVKKGAKIDINFLPVNGRITPFDQILIQQFIHKNFVTTYVFSQSSQKCLAFGK